MKLTVRDPGGAALRKAARPAIVMPVLFAICSAAFENPQASLFAAFGSFSMLVFADFGGPARKRLGAYVALTAGGAALIVVATLVSESTWLSVVTMALVGFAVAFGSVLGGYVAAGSLAAILAFVLAVAVPADAGDIPARLIGWCLAGVFATAAALLLWPRYEHTELGRALTAAMRKVADLIEASIARVVDPDLVARRRQTALESTRSVVRVYRTMAYRPSGPTTHDQAIGFLTDQLPWLRAFADELAADRLGGGGIAVEDERLGASTIGALRGSATEFETRRVTEASGDLEAAREDYYAAVAASTQRHIAAHDASDTIVESIRRAFRLRLISYISMSVSGNTSILFGRPVAPGDYEIPPLVPQPGLTQTVRGLGAIIRSHLTLDSIWFRAAVRAALALGLAVLIAKVSDVQHAFWVVLATLTVLKSNAISTGYAAWQALAGTLVGFGLSTAVIFGIHDSRTALWILFPICVFLAAYTPTAVHVAVGQAMFTVMVVVLFNLIEPQGWWTGLVRVEDILIGAATGIVVGVLLWPRGARAELCQALSSLYETGGAYIRAALDAALGRQREPVAPAAEEAHAADLRAGEALSTYLKERGPKRVPVEVWTRLLVTGEQLRFVADAVVVRTSVFGEVEGFERAVKAVDAEAGILTEQIDRVAQDISGTGDVGAAPPPHGDRTRAIIVASLEACGRDPSVGNVEQVLALAWASEWIGHVRTRVAALQEPLGEVRSFVAGSWWR